MSFMIDEDDADEAIRSLHRVFFADPDPEVFDVAARVLTGAETSASTARGRSAS